jgi:hypothetical protein
VKQNRKNQMKKLWISFLMTAGSLYTSYGQGSPAPVITGQDTTKRPITTAVPFVNIAPDARSSGMGDAGVALLDADANAAYWNPARIAFAEKKAEVSLSYSPWLRKLVNDMSLTFLSGYYKWDERQAVDLSLTYFDLGDIQFTDQNNQSLGDYRPREFAIRAHYSVLLSEYFSMAVGGFFIHSNIAGNVSTSQTAQAKPGNSAGADVAAFYRRQGLNIANQEVDVALGVNISNIGTKMSYSDNNVKDFIPTNLRLGTAVALHLDPYNKMTFLIDANKLLVPTPPLVDRQGNIVKGEDPRNLTLLQGIFRSFSDAPNGFQEEMQEFVGNFGVEYSYQDLFFARAGYATEHKNKGDRKYFSVGLGARYQVFGIDVAYLIPTQRNHPLAETLRFTLRVAFDKQKGSGE